MADTFIAAAQDFAGHVFAASRPLLPQQRHNHSFQMYAHMPIASPVHARHAHTQSNLRTQALLEAFREALGLAQIAVLFVVLVTSAAGGPAFSGHA